MQKSLIELTDEAAALLDLPAWFDMLSANEGTQR